MSKNLPGIEETVIMSQRMGVPFYAGAIHSETPPGSPNRVREYAAETDASYLVVCDWTTPTRRPQLAFILDGDGSQIPWLKKIHEVSWRGNRAVLYQFLTEQEGI